MGAFELEGSLTERRFYKKIIVSSNQARTANMLLNYPFFNEFIISPSITLYIPRY